MDKDVVEKCLAFCQALTSNNHLFSFSLKIGNDAFNFDLKELAKSSCIKKKKSPSQMRRETRRREERRRAATKAEEDIAETSEQSANVKPKCDSCDTSFNSEEELSAHIQSVHTTPEKERGSESQIELKLSPIQTQRNEEKLSEQDSFLLLMLLLLQKRSLCSSALVSFVKDASRKMDISVTHLKPRHYVETATGAILISDADRRRDGTEEEL